MPDPSCALLVTRNLPPAIGGMERLNERIVACLARRGRALVCGPAGFARHALGPDAPAELAGAPLRIVEVRRNPAPLFLAGAALATLGLALRHRPAVVVAGSGLLAPVAWLAARATGARALVFVHGLDVIVDHPVYRRVWLPFLRRCDAVVANSRSTADAAAAAGVPADRIAVVNPGTVLPTGAADGAAFRRRLGVGDGPLLLSVGRVIPRKGLAEFVRHALPAILQARPDATLAVVGADPPDALAARRGETARIRAAAGEAGVAHAVRFAGAVSDDVLEDAFAAAGVLVFPVLDLPGDVEGFGMVAIEAAARGVPTVAFAAGGVVDAVADGRSGRLVPAGDYATFAAATLDALADRGAEAAARCREFAAGFAWPRFDERFGAQVAALASA